MNETIRGFGQNYNLLVVLGPTASGKTSLAVRLARRIGGEIISADSRQVYRGMDLGTGKDLAEYSRGGDAVPFHLIDLLEPFEEFSVFAYQTHFYRCFEKVQTRGKIPIMVGGSGLYLDSIIRGYCLLEVPEDKNLHTGLERETMGTLRRRFLSLNPGTHNTTDLLERKRLIRAIEIAEHTRNQSGESEAPAKISPFVIGIRCDRAELRRHITARLRSRLEGGMLEEVNRLHRDGIAWERMDAFGLEYRYAGLYLRGEINYETMFEVLNTRIHQFAKRQETWFRGMEKKGVKINWISGADENTALAVIGKAMI